MTSAVLKTVGLLSITAFCTLGTMACTEYREPGRPIEYRERERHIDRRDWHDHREHGGREFGRASFEPAMIDS
jgi:hypothetical protein